MPAVVSHFQRRSVAIFDALSKYLEELDALLQDEKASKTAGFRRGYFIRDEENKRQFYEDEDGSFLFNKLSGEFVYYPKSLIVCEKSTSRNATV